MKIEIIKVILVLLLFLSYRPMVGESINDPYSSPIEQKALQEALCFVHLFTPGYKFSIEETTDDIVGIMTHNADDSTYNAVLQYLYGGDYKNTYPEIHTKSEYLQRLSYNNEFNDSTGNYKVSVSPPYLGFINIDLKKYYFSKKWNRGRWDIYATFIFRYCNLSGKIVYMEKLEYDKDFVE